MNLDQWFRICHLKSFLILALVAILFSRVEWDGLCNFGSWHCKEHFCELILKSDQVLLEKMLFKDVSFLEFGGRLVQRSRTACAILVDGIIRKFFVKLF